MPCKMVSIKKIAVLGGSGMTGICVVEQALTLGLSVRLLLRPTSELPADVVDKVEIVRGDVTDAGAVKDAITGTDGVVVALGTRNKLEATTMMSTGVKNALAAMAELNIKPITICLSSFLLMPPGAVPVMFIELNLEHGRMLAAVEASQADWVAILPPHIADNPPSEYLVKEGALPGGRVVSKRDLAAFLIEALSKPEYYRKKMAISSKQ